MKLLSKDNCFIRFQCKLKGMNATILKTFNVISIIFSLCSINVEINIINNNILIIFINNIFNNMYYL